MDFILSSETDWSLHIPNILQVLGDRKILCLEGDLGAGKTTFTKSLLAYLRSTDIVQSPTFSLINIYGYPKDGNMLNLYHIDLYRLNQIEDALEIGIEEIIDSGSLCVIEWPQLIYPLLDNYALMKLTVSDNNRRSVTFN